MNFIKGLFDSDGGITISKANKISILINSSTPTFIDNVNSLLKDLGINFGGPYKSSSGKGLEIRTFKTKEIVKFEKLIGSLHPIKSQKLHASVAQLVERQFRTTSERGSARDS